MDERTDRILQVAMELAERDGYDAVRLRDVAKQAEVALGTVYRRFSCKEDILAAALNLQVSAFHDAIRIRPIPGEDGRTRLSMLFDTATRVLAERPKLAAAMLRTVSSGVPELADRVSRYHGTMTDIILEVYRGTAEGTPTNDDRTLSVMLQSVWFAALVGWTGGLHDVDTVIDQVLLAMDLLIRGLESR
jgi:AcrR family transcriptional regulator